MNGRRFQAPPAVGQLLPSARTADLSEDGETLDSDVNDDLPSVKQILASSKRVMTSPVSRAPAFVDSEPLCFQVL